LYSDKENRQASGVENQVRYEFGIGWSSKKITEREDDGKSGQKNYRESLALVEDNAVGCNYFKVTSLTIPAGKAINSIPLTFLARQ